LRKKALRHVRERWRGRGWRRVRRAAAVDRRETTAAIFQIRGQAAAGSGPTTSSLRNLYLYFRLRLGAATRGQSQNADEAFGVLLIIARAHGEGGEVGAVERVIGLAADHVDVAFVEREPNRAGQILL